ncbi:hypothetical protein PUN28_004384 [Cardiocondyla obscurior]|uniref:Uncharacterized protein n=1 Tax=Cardiocondyla obscurior TaxID=286306 RepID=A0AAW2GD37_9HYME
MKVERKNYVSLSVFHYQIIVFSTCRRTFRVVLSRKKKKKCESPRKTRIPRARAARSTKIFFFCAKVQARAVVVEHANIFNGGSPEGYSFIDPLLFRLSNLKPIYVSSLRMCTTRAYA